MYCKGGSGTNDGAGGSGGRVNVVFHTGHYESGHVITNGLCWKLFEQNNIILNFSHIFY